MKTPFRLSLKLLSKPALFMLAAGVGCFLFALLAEPFLYFNQKPHEPEIESQFICLTIDVSGSMAGDNLVEVKEAAKNFIKKRELVQDKIAIVIFSSDGRILLPFTQDQDELFENIDRLNAYGGTNFEQAMSRSEAVVGKEPGRHFVLLFTDGDNSVGSPAKAVRTATQLRNEGVTIFVIATPDARDMNFLTRLTGSRDRIISTQSGDFGDAFTQAEVMISSASLVARQGTATYVGELPQTVFWTVLCCCGITFALVGTQNRLMKKPIFILRQFLLMLFASILAGTVAGFLAQTLYSMLIAIYLGEAGRLIAWAVLGGLLAAGMTFFIPNLDRKSALTFGAGGGFLGAIGFLILGVMLGDMAGRLLGAFILGACIGAMVGIVEVVFRKVWLAVVHTPRDVTVVNLGRELVTVGSGDGDTVLVRDVEPSAAEFRVEGNAVRYKGPDGKRTLEPGARVKLGNVELVICSPDVPFSPSRFYPMKFARAEEFKARGKMPPQG